MTYQEFFEKLQKDFAEKADIYLKKEVELAKTNGFGDINVSAEYFKAKSDWQKSSNDYWGFLSFVSKNKINPDDIININN